MAKAKLRRDTAKRSLDELFRLLPARATIEVIRRGTPPARGVDASITIEIAAPPSMQLQTLPGGPTVHGTPAAKAAEASGVSAKTPAAKKAKGAAGKK